MDHRSEKHASSEATIPFFTSYACNSMARLCNAVFKSQTRAPASKHCQFLSYNNKKKTDTVTMVTKIASNRNDNDSLKPKTQNPKPKPSTVTSPLKEAVLRQRFWRIRRLSRKAPRPSDFPKGLGFSVEGLRVHVLSLYMLRRKVVPMQALTLWAQSAWTIMVNSLGSYFNWVCDLGFWVMEPVAWPATGLIDSYSTTH